MVDKKLLYSPFDVRGWPDKVKDIIQSEDPNDPRVWHTRSRHHTRFYTELVPLGNYAWKCYQNGSYQFRLLRQKHSRDEAGIDGVISSGDRQLETIQITQTYYNKALADECKKMAKGVFKTHCYWVGQQLALIKQLVEQAIVKKITKKGSAGDTLLIGTTDHFVASILRQEYRDIRDELQATLEAEIDRHDGFPSIAVVDAEFVEPWECLLVSSTRFTR